ncbi:MAG: YneF family protein [Bacilli bacterium]|nr:YneF family protein [Bacilli bacterium]
MELLFDILKVLFGIIVGGVIGFFVCKNYMQKYLKKNPPINEQMIKIMMQQMGRTPSQKQINQMMKAMNKQM